jgi:hypothetical protein
MPRGPHLRSGFSAGFKLPAVSDPTWHETCFFSLALKKNSRSSSGSVNFFSRRAKSVSCERVRWSRRQDSSGLIHGAGGHGHRKRTHVRAACGDAKRPSGEGKFSTHGQLGRFVVGRFVCLRETNSHVVMPPVCEAVLRQRRLSRGPGLLAALTTAVVTSVRTPAHANRAFRATRPFSSAVIRAASSPPTPSGLSCGRERRTQPQPTHASATGQESTFSFHGDQIAQGSSRS